MLAIASCHSHLPLLSCVQTCSHLGMVQRDPNVWKNPNAFKADRFGSKTRPQVVPSPKLRAREGDTEPLPTLCAGYPLGLLHDDEYFRHSHACVFGRLMQPLLKQWVRRLVGDFEFALESNGDAVSAPAGTEADPMAVQLPPDVLRGGKSLCRCVCLWSCMPDYRIKMYVTFGLLCNRSKPQC